MKELSRRELLTRASAFVLAGTGTALAVRGVTMTQPEIQEDIVLDHQPFSTSEATPVAIRGGEVIDVTSQMRLSNREYDYLDREGQRFQKFGALTKVDIQDQDNFSVEDDTIVLPENLFRSSPQAIHRHDIEIPHAFMYSILHNINPRTDEGGRIKAFGQYKEQFDILQGEIATQDVDVNGFINEFSLVPASLRSEDDYKRRQQELTDPYHFFASMVNIFHQFPEYLADTYNGLPSHEGYDYNMTSASYTIDSPEKRQLQRGASIVYNCLVGMTLDAKGKSHEYKKRTVSEAIDEMSSLRFNLGLVI